MAEKLLNKPLYCCLRGLLNQIDRSTDIRITQIVIDSATVLLVELQRLDSEVNRHG